MQMPCILIMGAAPSFSLHCGELLESRLGSKQCLLQRETHDAYVKFRQSLTECLLYATYFVFLHNPYKADVIVSVLWTMKLKF